MTTATITREIGAQIFETLYALDGRFETVPHLAESHEVQDGGKRYVIQLRKGVRFHNGKEMGAADVVASLKRWGAVSSTGKTIFKTVEAVEARGPSTVEIRLREPSVILPTALGAIGPFAAIYPKEVIDASGDGPLKEFVGTGPFRLAEHRPDRHIKLVRFDGYAARSEAPSGLAGQRTAYLDELLFMPVPEEATRYAGLTSGEYGFAQQLRPDHYEGLRTATGVAPIVVKPYGWAVLVLNLKQGLLTDKRIRQAIQAAVNVDPAMLVAMGHRDFYRVDPGLFFPEQAWHSKAGARLYDQKDPAKARRLLQEAGYQGQPVRWMVTTEYEHHYKPALAVKSQLEEIGLKIDLQVSDWATRGPAAQQGRAVGHLQHGRRLRRRAEHLGPGPVRVARLVVHAREGRPPPGDGTGARRQEAPCPLGEGPGALLRGRRAHQARRLLPDGWPARRRPGIPGRPVHAVLERLARPEIARGRPGAGQTPDGTSDWRRAPRSDVARQPGQCGPASAA